MTRKNIDNDFVRFTVWYENQPTVVSFNGKVYTMINMFKGLLNETLFVMMDDKNNYKVFAYEDLKHKKFRVIAQ